MHVHSEVNWPQQVPLLWSVAANTCAQGGLCQVQQLCVATGLTSFASKWHVCQTKQPCLLCRKHTSILLVEYTAEHLTQWTAHRQLCRQRRAAQPSLPLPAALSPGVGHSHCVEKAELVALLARTQTSGAARAQQQQQHSDYNNPFWDEARCDIQALAAHGAVLQGRGGRV
jgi:hypothetical protein